MRIHEIGPSDFGPRGMMTPRWLFRDRVDAGRQLALRLERYRSERPIILALPRGGVPVAAEVAEALDATLDVLPVRKLGVPGHRELGVGAIALGGASVLNEDTIRMLGITRAQLAAVEGEERVELERQRQRFRDEEPLPDLRDRTVIIVDDGLATGVSALAAIRAVRALSPRRLVLAVPVCAPETASELRAEVDDLVYVASPADFYAVGLWYRDFSQTTDETVIELLKTAKGRSLAARPK
jgi:putative phosphoribosyl transferase